MFAERLAASLRGPRAIAGLPNDYVCESQGFTTDPSGAGGVKRVVDTGWTHDPLTPTHTFHTLAHLEIQRLVSKTSRWNKSIVYLYIREIEMQKLIKRLNA